MPNISRTKTWVSDETLTASDLNAEFDGILAGVNNNALDEDNLDSTATYTFGDAIVSNGGGVVIGNATQVASTATYEMQVLGTGDADSGMMAGRWSNDTGVASLEFVKSASGTIGTSAAITTGWQLGRIRGLGADGTDHATAGTEISFSTEGTIATNRIPGLMIFKTGTDAAPTVLTEALRINSAQLATFAGGVTITGAAQLNSTLTVGVDDTGYDVKFFGATAGSFLQWDESADSLLLTDSTPLKIGDGLDLTLYHDGTNSYITNAVGALKIATETSGIAVTIGHTTSEVTVADNLTVTGTLTLGSGAELTEAELEFLDGITAGTVAASKAVVVDSNKDAASFRNITLTGELDAATLDISGNGDIAGTLGVTGVTTHGGNVVSDTDSTDDLGTTGVRWKDLYIDSITCTDQITATGFTGTLDGILGSGAAAAATVTTLAAGGDVTVANGYGMVIGHTAQITDVGGITPEFQLLGTGNADSAMLWGRWSADANPSFLNVVKGRGAIGATNTIVSGDTIFRMDMYAEDGTTTPILSSRLDFDTEGTIANSQAPGVIVAWTANSSGTITEALRIDSAQNATFASDVFAGAKGAGKIRLMGSEANSAVWWYTDGTYGKIHRNNSNGNMVIQSQTVGTTNLLLQPEEGVVTNPLDNSGYYTGGGDDTRLYFNATNAVLATAGALILQTNGTTEAMRIDSAGKVDVGAPASHAGTSHPLNVGSSGGSNVRLIGRNNGGVDEASITVHKYDGSTSHGSINFSSQTMAFSTATTERMRIDSSGMVGIGETLNGNMTVGLTINQGAADNEAFALKSSDIGHAMTAASEADTYFAIQKAGGLAGGARLIGYKDADGGAGQAVGMFGRLGEAADTTKSTSGIGIVELRGSVTDGSTDVAAVASNGNLVHISNNGTARFIFDAEGDSHQDVGTAWTNFDNEPDALIARSVGIVMDPSTIVKTRFDDWGRDHKEDLIRTGLIPRLTPEQEADGERPLMNTTQLTRLHNGAIWQTHVEVQQMKEDFSEALDAKESRIAALESQIKGLLN